MVLVSSWVQNPETIPDNLFKSLVIFSKKKKKLKKTKTKVESETCEPIDN